MLSSLTTLRDTQAARSATGAVLGPNPYSASLEGFRQRNAFLDSVFYDVSMISETEARKIGPWLAKEGALLHVPPTGGGDLVLCTDMDELASLPAAAALAIAGVGSSALGSAAFARNVADALGAPAVAIVSGYGLSDVMSEALGGWFFFGTTNRLRHSFENFDESFNPSRMADGLDFARTSKDTKTAVSLLQDARFSFKILTGHSKGNLVLSEALFELNKLDSIPALSGHNPMIVTVSATIAMPKRDIPVIDIMGQWDWLGRLNSQSSIRPEFVVPNAWHHTNTELPLHLPVTQTMRRVIEAKPQL